VAVYTPVSEAELAAFVAGYRLGAPISLTGIAEGIENSNFALVTEQGRFILTVFERRAKAGDLPFFLDLMGWLSTHGFPSPEPVANREGETLGTLCGKPAAIVSFLEGRPIEPPTVAACHEAGAGAARLALASAGFPTPRANDLGRASWRGLFAGHEALADRLRPGLAAEIAADLDALEAAWPRDLPEGVIHADLFADNAFFRGGRFAGVIDFYFACTEALAYELAVMLNAWAFDAPTVLDPAKGKALLEGYQSIRPLTHTERAALPILARGAAMRFFLTRLADWDATPEGALVTRKDPLDYADRLAVHRDAAVGRRPPLLELA
jgi:homoserine kinase type II